MAVSEPTLVPNWKITLLIEVVLVIPGAFNVNESVVFVNGLCGGFPAIEPLLDAYVA